MNYTKDELALLTIDTINGISLGKKHKILQMLDSPKDIFEGFMFDQVDFLTAEMLKKVQFSVSPISQKILESELEKLDCEIVTMESFDYPQKLKEIYEPPLCLYYRGNIKLLSDVVVSIVGARRSTIYGKDVASKMVDKLSEKNIVIATGMADGIDRDVLDYAEENQSTTIIVCAGGIDKIVPSINAGIVKKVAKNGVIFSEHQPNVSPQKYHYAMRNRIFAGISNAIIIAEAEKDSSSIEIASQGVEYGKEVFSVPGSIFSSASKGTNALIANAGAIALYDEKQIFDALQVDYSFASSTKTISVDETESEILKSIEDGKIHLSEIAEQTQISMATLLSKLIMLEAKGIIQSIGGNRYQKRNF